LVELGDVEDLVGVEVTGVVLVDLLEACIQLLDLLFAELAWEFGVTHFKNTTYSRSYRLSTRNMGIFMRLTASLKIPSFFIYFL
jgi:hypothetical protein